MAENFTGSILDGYSGAAIFVRPDGYVIAANAKGSSLEALIAQGAIPEIPSMIQHAASNNTIASGAISLAGKNGTIVLEITVVPQTDSNILLVLSRDMTMERNLRSTLVESRQRYKDLVEISSDFSWETGVDGTFIFISPRGALGYSAEEMVNRNPEELVINPQEYSPLPFVSKRRMEDVEMWMRKADGTTACVIVSCLPLGSKDGEWHGVRGICRDITEDRARETALSHARNREQLLNYIIGAIRDEIEPNNMLTTAAAATARALGAAGCGIFRQSKPDVFTLAAKYGNDAGLKSLGKLMNKLKDNDGIIEVEVGKWQVLIAGTHYRQSINGAISMWKKAKGESWHDDNRILIVDVANQLGIANEQITNHERILKLSRTDGLTGLLNRRAFYEEELPKRLARLKQNAETAALFYLDLDNFKMVNDIHGHQCGDDALLYLRDMLIDFSRPGDVIARLGGDEFAMWLDGISTEVTEKRVKELLTVGNKKLLPLSGDKEHPLGLSIGVAMYDPLSDEPLDKLLVRSDEAMYAVKRDGKGGYRIAAPAQNNGHQ